MRSGSTRFIMRLPKHSRVRAKCLDAQCLTEEEKQACDGLEKALSRAHESYEWAATGDSGFDLVYSLNQRAYIQRLCPGLSKKEHLIEYDMIDDTYDKLNAEKHPKAFKRDCPKTYKYLKKNWPERAGLFRRKELYGYSVEEEVAEYETLDAKSSKPKLCIIM